MYSIVLHSHSAIRYIAIIALLWAIGNALTGVIAKKTYPAGKSKIDLWAMAIFHIQVLLGFMLYFISPKVQFSGEMMKSAILRFFTMEHILLMIIAVVLITIGYVKAKKNPDKGFKSIFVYYTIALLLVLAAIPWPFRSALGASWF